METTKNKLSIEFWHNRQSNASLTWIRAKNNHDIQLIKITQLYDTEVQQNMLYGAYIEDKYQRMAIANSQYWLCPYKTDDV